MKIIVVTGGTGFIGSHICVKLIERGYSVLILDSFINSSPKIVDKIKEINYASNKSSSPYIKVIKCDLRDFELLKNIFIKYSKNNHNIEAVIHLAGLKAVNESIIEPIKYWENNVTSTINLIKIMERCGCKNIVFSSSATIYGYQENKSLINENSSIMPLNTYGETKYIIEMILNSLVNSKKKDWRVAILRYFNPIGAHFSGIIGEIPNKYATNIMPIINSVALKRINYLSIFGNDWDTPDGTPIRDYIHVEDLAEGHIKALKQICERKLKQITLNLGTGNGSSVLELIKVFEEVNNIKIPYKFAPRREGDIEYSVADNSLAKEILKWSPQKDLRQMCKDNWNWISKNPDGLIN